MKIIPKTKMPDDEQIDIALLWLESNEGDERESGACRAVAKWIEYLRQEAFIRVWARGSAVTIPVARKLLAKGD